MQKKEKTPSYTSYQLYFGPSHPDGAGAGRTFDGEPINQKHALAVRSGAFVHLSLLDGHGREVACTAESPPHIAYFFRRVAALAIEGVLGLAESEPEHDEGLMLARVVCRTVESGRTLVLELHEPSSDHSGASDLVYGGRVASIARPVEDFIPFLQFAATVIQRAYEANGREEEEGGGEPWEDRYFPSGEYFDREDNPIPTS